MKNIRIFPTLSILNGDLVKTYLFNKPQYLGDPINAIKLFNNKEIDEICILDISDRYLGNFNFDFKTLKEMALEAFLPLSYGGNIKTLDDASNIISLGFEKVIVSSIFFNKISEVIKISNQLGSQSVVLKIDYTLIKNKYYLFSEGRILNEINYIDLIKNIHYSRVGELILSRIDLDGSMSGYDLDFPIRIKNHLNIPIVLAHGAKDSNSINYAYSKGFYNFTASSAYVYVGSNRGILINNPFVKINQ